MHLLPVFAFDLNPGDQLTGCWSSLEGHTGDARLRFYHRADVFNLLNRVKDIYC